MTIFSLVGEILLKDNNTKQKLEEIEGAGSKTGLTLDGAFSKIGSALLKLGAVVGVTMGFNALFSAASTGQQTMAQMEAVLKSTGDASGMTKNQLVDLANNLSKVTTFSASTTKQAENMLLTFTNIKSSVFPQTISAAQDMATALGMNLTDATMTLGKALNDPAQGLTRLTRQGVTFTAAQKEQIATMEKVGNVAGAQKVILQELEKEFGGSAKAAGSTFAGQLTILRNQLTGVGVGIVSKLLPPLTTLVTTINNYMPQIQAITTSVINGIGNAVNSVMPIIEKIIEDGIKIAGNIFPNISGSAGGLSRAIANLVSGGLTVLKNVMDWLAQHGSIVRAGFIGITMALAGYKAVVMASNAVQEVQNAMLAMSAIRQGEAALAMNVMKNSTTSATAAQWLLNAAMDANSIGIIVVAIGALIAILVLAYNKSETFRNIVQSAFGDISSFVSNACDIVKDVISAAFESIKTAWEDVLKPVLDFLIQTFGQVLKWVQDNWPLISQTIGTVMGAIKDIIETVMNIIKPIWQAAWEVLKAVVPPIWDVIKDIVSTAIKVIEDVIKLAMDLINGNWGSAWKDVVKLVKDIFGGVGNIIKDILSGVGNIFKNIAGTALSWGGDLVNGIIKGIRDKINDVKQAAADVGNAIKSFLHFSVPDEGPLTDYETWMPDFMTGLANGIDSNKFKVTDKIKELAGDMKLNTTIASKKEDASLSANSSQTNEPKQPILLQLILQNGKVLAEYLIDDINKLQGTMQLSNSRLNLGRR